MTHQHEPTGLSSHICAGRSSFDFHSMCNGASNVSLTKDQSKLDESDPNDDSCTKLQPDLWISVDPDADFAGNMTNFHEEGLTSSANERNDTISKMEGNDIAASLP